jgi:predicted P-loop ATPase
MVLHSTFLTGAAMSTLRVPPPNASSSASEHARAETERKKALFDWCDRVLQELGLADAIARATTAQEQARVVFDEIDADVAMAIRDALHPASGQKADCFAGLREGSLKRLLNARFLDLKKDREAKLLNPGSAGGGAQHAPDWTADLILDKDGGVVPLLANLILFLRSHPSWQGVLGFDEFGANVVIRRPPPWGAEAPDTPWTDHFESLTRAWFQQQDIRASQGDVGRAVQTAARYNTFHPVRDYLEALVWDGTGRIDRWLVTYFHADDTAYTRAIGPRFLISGVARIHSPGCKVDYMPVFEGPQGRQKSATLDALTSPWFADRISGINTKDASIETSGAWFIEVAEMDALRKVSSSSKKAFLTRRFERYRPPHGKHLVKRPRQCLFVGTINPPVGGYLTDTTGDRRLWPVACRAMIDREGVERDRDQLWAEAVFRFRRGDPWWLTPELEALARAEQEARFMTDIWHDRVANWVETRADVSVVEVVEYAVGIAPENQTQPHWNRVSAILTNLDYVRVRSRNSTDEGPKRPNRYRREKV